MDFAGDSQAIPPFEATPLDDIRQTNQRLHQTFRSNRTKSLDYRIHQLRRLYWGIKDNAELLTAALARDLRKSYVESMMAEVDWCLQDCLYAQNNLRKWAQEEKFADVPLHFSLLRARIRKEPLGPALIIGAYNFPVNLTFGPLVGAIAAGCPAVIKPSESAPATAMVMEKIVRETLDTMAYACVNGGIPESSELLDLPWAKIFYTGGAAVGTIVATKAAKRLIPVTLELGGKNPAFVTRSADLPLAARRLLWGKSHNAGQVCISHNYVLVDRVVLQPLVDELKKAYRDFFPDGARESPDLARIINRRHFDRIKKMIDSSKGRLVLGGHTDADDLYIEPTAIVIDDPHDPVLEEESFGPLFGIVPFDTLDEAIALMHQMDQTPLALYCFGTKQEQERILDECISGGATMNDSWFHAAVPTLPFGGVGSSGEGSYRGKASFDAFTHRRSVVTTPGWMDGILRGRYMPYSREKYQQLAVTNAKPNFDRNCKDVLDFTYWVKFVLGLGANGTQAALARWLALLAAIVAWRMGLLRRS